MNKLKKLQGKIGKKDVLLPNIDSIISNLRERITNLQQCKEDSLEIDDEMIYQEEIVKAEALIKSIEKQKEEDIDNDETLINTHSLLELQYFLEKEKIVNKLTNHQKIFLEDLNGYNSAVWDYNLFVNVVESV